MHESATIFDSAYINGPCIIGPKTEVRQCAFIRGSALIGDKLFIYTDGVPEATDEVNELFGRDRMLSALNEKKEAEVKDIVVHVRSEIDKFVNGAQQFDDITMLTIEYKNVL